MDSGIIEAVFQRHGLLNVAIKKTPPGTVSTDKRNASDPHSLDQYIGPILRSQRLAQGLTLNDVAVLAGISRGMLSKIENSQVSTSLDTLHLIVSALGMTLSQLFRNFDVPEGSAQHVKAGDGLEVVRRGTKRGHTYHLLAYDQGPQKQVEPFLISMDDASEVFPTFIHPGIEFIYVLEGEMEYRHGRNTYRLQPGDSLTFQANVPHGPENLIKVPIKILSVINYGVET